MRKLYAAVYAVGASLAEINPLATTPNGQVIALDAKVVIDDNELERHPEIAALRDATAEAPSEVAAREAGLTFKKLERSEEHTSELQSRLHLVCRLLLEKKKIDK